jgi:hypothetical protein
MHLDIRLSLPTIARVDVIGTPSILAYRETPTAFLEVLVENV